MPFNTKDIAWAWIFTLLLVLGLVGLVYAISGLAPSAIPWNFISNYDSSTELIGTHAVGLLELPLLSDVFLKTAQISGGVPRQSDLLYALFAGVWIISLASLLSLADEFSSQIFYVLMGFAALLLYMLRVDLWIEGGANYPFLSYLFPILLLGPALAGFILGQKLSFTPRFFAYLLYATGLAYLSRHFNTLPFHELPFQVLSAFPLFFLLFVISQLFIIHELPALFVELSTRKRSSKPGANMGNFFLLLILYLATLLLYYLNSTGKIRFEMPYFNPFVLWMISLVLAIRSLPFRLQSAGQQAPAIPLRMALIALALPTMLLIAYAQLIAQDLMLEALEDMIIQGHLAGAAFFTVYMLINFIGPLWENAPVYKVLYKPYLMGSWLLMFTTVLCALALFYATDLTPYYQWMSGRYTQEAGLHLQADRPAQAKPLLDLAMGYSSRGNRQHYLMGLINHQERELGQAFFHFKEAQEKNPNAAAGLNLIRNYRLRDKFFEAKDEAEKGWKETGEPAYAFALGNLYLETRLLDSAAFYYREAERGAEQLKQPVQTNLDAVIYQSRSEALMQERVMDYKQTGSHSINLSVLQPDFNLLELMPRAENLADSFAIIHNYLHYQGHTLPSESLEWIRNISEGWVFPYYKEQIKDKLAQSYFLSGRIALMQGVESQLHKNEVANRLLYLEKAAKRALEFRKFPLVKDFMAAMPLEAGEKVDPLLILLTELNDGLLRSEDQVAKLNDKNLSGLMAFINGTKGNDSTHYWSLWFQADKATLPFLQGQLTQISDNELRNRAFFDVSYALFISGKREALTEWVYQDSTEELISSSLLQSLRKDVAFLNRQSPEGAGVLWAAKEQQSLQTWRESSLTDSIEVQPAIHLWMDGLVLQVAEELVEKDEGMEAYQLLLAAHQANPYGVEILKAYIILCRIQNLAAFEQRGLEKLRLLLSPPDYENYLQSLPMRMNF